MWIISIILFLIFILMSIMFFTLLERKILSYSQSRVGPNKISMIGIIQPLLDGVKLMLNEKTSSFKNNKYIYLLGPMILFIVMMMIWLLMPMYFVYYSMNFSLLFFMVCLSFSIYSSLLSGWSSNSKFSMLGSVRSMAQTISYELTLIFIMFMLFIWLNSMNLFTFYMLKSSFFFCIFPIIMIWIVNILSECGRAPFDFMEGESELVSGFNTEFSSSGFAILFVGEYGMIIFFSIMTSILFTFFSFTMMMMMSFLCMSIFLIVRSSFPRFRYDFLMDLAWMKLLPFSILFLLFLYMYL